tara:strand:+ start:272 stop:859 length:588 start_codon:yes stop_codon:yes gene_type:complete
MKSRSNRWDEINKNLTICRKIAVMLKQKNPDQVMRLYKNTIVAYRKNSKVNKHRGYAEESPISGDTIAHMHVDDPHFGVCITQHFLFHATCLNDSNVIIEGNWALIDVVCHELAHFSTHGEDEWDSNTSTWNTHGKAFQKVYQKFLRQMVLEVISGNYYTSINSIELDRLLPLVNYEYLDEWEKEDAFWDTVLAK